MKLNAGKIDSKKTFTPNLDLLKNVTLRSINTLLLSPRSIKKIKTATFSKMFTNVYY